MTEKRFERIYADVDVFCRDHNAKGISQLLEKEDYDTIVDLLNRLNDENEQLKADNNRLVNETAKVVAEHQRKVLDLIDDKIDELEGRYKFGQEVYKGCPMHNICFGINVLKELKRELQE